MSASACSASSIRNFAWDGERLYADDDLRPARAPPRGCAARAAVVAGRRRRAGGSSATRSGINKLFWARDADGRVVVAARPGALVADGHARSTRSARSRAARSIDLDRAAATPAEQSLGPGRAGSRPSSEAASRRSGARSARRSTATSPRSRPRTLARRRLRLPLRRPRQLRHRRARPEHFPEPVAVSFDLDAARRGASEDRPTAERLAARLGMPLLEATVTGDELLAHARHRARRGHRLARLQRPRRDWSTPRSPTASRAAGGGRAAARLHRRPGQRVPGRLPARALPRRDLLRAPPARRRPRCAPAWCAASTPATARSGVFGAWGLRLVQPYAVAVDAYLALPEAASSPARPQGAALPRDLRRARSRPTSTSARRRAPRSAAGSRRRRARGLRRPRHRRGARCAGGSPSFTASTTRRSSIASSARGATERRCPRSGADR